MSDALTVIPSIKPLILQDYRQKMIRAQLTLTITTITSSTSSKLTRFTNLSKPQTVSTTGLTSQLLKYLVFYDKKIHKIPDISFSVPLLIFTDILPFIGII